MMYKNIIFEYTVNMEEMHHTKMSFKIETLMHLCLQMK